MLQARRKSVIPLENGIQVKGMGMDPGFHRGDDKAWIPAFAGKTEGAVDFESTLLESLGFYPRAVKTLVLLPIDSIEELGWRGKKTFWCSTDRI